MTAEAVATPAEAERVSRALDALGVLVAAEALLVARGWVRVMARDDRASGPLTATAALFIAAGGATQAWQNARARVWQVIGCDALWTWEQAHARGSEQVFDALRRAAEIGAAGGDS